MKPYDSIQYFLEDYQKTLFPLETNRIVIKNKHQEIKEYIGKIIDKKQKEHFFLPQESFPQKVTRSVAECEH